MRGEEQLERTGFQEARFEERIAEPDEVLRRGEIAAACPLVALVHLRREGVFAEQIVGVKLRAIGIDGALDVGTGVFETERPDDVLIHVGHEILL